MLSIYRKEIYCCYERNLQQFIWIIVVLSIHSNSFCYYKEDTKMGNKAFDVTALGELLIDFTENGTSAQGNPML